MSKQIDLGEATAYAIAKKHGYVGTEVQFAAEMTGAAESARAAAQDASDAEAYAIGKRDGTDVPSTDPAYHNNAKYWSQQAPSVTSIAPAYSASSTYAVGDYVTYNNRLYECTTAITTAEAWNSSHWTETSVSSEVSDLKDNLNQSVKYISQVRSIAQKERARGNIDAEANLGVEYSDIENLFDASNITLDKAVWPSDGLLHNTPGYFASDYILIHDIEKIILTGFNTSAVYDANKTHIRNLQPTQSHIESVLYEVPQEVYYIRVTAITDDITPCSITKEYPTFEIPKLIVDKSQVLGIDDEDETTKLVSEKVGIYKPTTLNGYTIPHYAYSGTGGIMGNDVIYLTHRFIIDSERNVRCGIKFNTCSLFDENGDFIRRFNYAGAGNDTVTITDDNAVYIALTFNMNYYTPLDVRDATIDGVYVSDKDQIITVGSSGKMFTGVLAAFKFAYAIGGHRIVNIYEGDYDLYSEAGGDTFVASIPADATWSSGIQTIFDNGITINGIGNVILRYEIPNSVYSQYTHQCTRLSPINTRGSIYVNNLTFILKNIRYAIHDEYGNDVLFANTKHKFDNLYVYADNCLACIGVGASGSEYEISNCVLQNDGNAIYLHNWPNTKGGRLTIKNCVMKNGLLFSVLGNDVFDVSVLSCYTPVVRIKREEDTYTVNCFRFVGLNNNFDSITIDDVLTSSLYEPIVL